MTSDAHVKSVAPQPKRRWLQFGLRTMLGLIAIMAVVLALVVVPAERQRRAVAAVLQLDGRVYYEDEIRQRIGRNFKRAWHRGSWGDDYFSSVIAVVLSRTEVTDAGLKHLAGLTRLETLALDHTRITDAGLANLKGLTRLHSLTLRDTQVTDAGLASLRTLTRLEWLSLDGAPVTEAGIAELQKALPKCQIKWP